MTHSPPRSKRHRTCRGARLGPSGYLNEALASCSGRPVVTDASVWAGCPRIWRLALTDSNDTTDAEHPPQVTILTALRTPPLALALRARGIVVTVVDHPEACRSMPAPGLLLVDAESLSPGEVAGLPALFDELDRHNIPSMLVVSGLDRVDPAYVERLISRGTSDGEPSVK